MMAVESVSHCRGPQSMSPTKHKEDQQRCPKGREVDRDP